MGVKYYSFEGNNLPFLSLCQLRDKAARTLFTIWPTGGILNRPPANELKTGLLGGLLSGYCGFYLEIENKSKTKSQEITIYKSTTEFYNIGMKLRPVGGAVASLVGLGSLLAWAW